MTTNELRTRCAELLGWQFRPYGYDPTPEMTLEDKAKATFCWVKPGNDFHQLQELPNYPADANACREIFDFLNDKLDLRSQWLSRLHILLNYENPTLPTTDWEKITVSPEILCRAFVEVMGKND